MTKPLNFTKIEKSYLPVTFADEKNTTILVGTPTKAILDELTSYQDKIEELENNENATNELFDVCAKIMSRNKTGAKITRKYLESVLDFEDIKVFFHAYIDFISNVINSKN